MEPNQITSIADIIGLWGTTPIGRKRKANIALSIDLNIPATVVRSMRHRNSISKRYWSDLIAAAERHAKDPTTSPGFQYVNAKLLIELSAVHRPCVDSASVSVPASAL